MQRFEYRVVPAPRKGERVRGVKRTDDRFAKTLMGVMNELGSEGWEYLRADTLPCEERVGLTGKTTTFQNMLVFRRVILEKVETPTEAVSVSAAPAPTTAPLTETVEKEVPQTTTAAVEPKITVPRRVTTAEAASADKGPQADTGETRTGLAAE